MKGTELQVERLLKLFDVRVRRAWTVRQISQALSDAGLTTLPDFSTCRPGTSVRLVALSAVPVGVSEDEGDGSDSEGVVDPFPSDTLPRRLLIGDLPPACGGVAGVPVTATLKQAIYLMQHNGYAQIPVTSDMTNLHGVVTWRSLALMYANGKPATLENAMQQDSLPVAEIRQEFFSCLPMLVEHGYLLVRGQDGALSGIVTHRHVVNRFQNAARPFFLLGEIESLLRRWLGSALSGEAIKAVQTRKKPELRSSRIEDLMFGDYIFLLDGSVSGNKQKEESAQRADQNWATLAHPSLDREEFLHHLRRVKDIRNRIAHFDAKPLPTKDMRELTAFTGLLREYVC